MGNSLWAAPPPGFALAAETQHFSFYTRSKQKIDSGKSERYLAQVEALLGQPLDGRAEYFYYERPEDIAAATGTYAAGLTYVAAREIHSTRAFHPHEIVHLLAGQLGNPGVFFQEGLAVVIGDERKWYGRKVDDLARPVAAQLRPQMLASRFTDLDPNVAYPVAGSFVAHVIDRHGVAKVREFLQACGPGQGWERAFARVFGQSFEAAWTDWSRSLSGSPA